MASAWNRRLLLLIVSALVGMRIGEAAHPGPGYSCCLDDPEGDDWAPGSSDDDQWQLAAPSPFVDIAPSQEDVEEAGSQGTSSFRSSVLSNVQTSQPAHPSDIGLSGEQLDKWQWAERLLHRPLGKGKAARAPTEDRPPALAAGATFVAATKFMGNLPGAYFTMGGQGLGYYVDTTSDIRGAPSGAAAGARSAPASIYLHKAIGTANPCHPDSAAWTRRRKARRPRFANGCRRRRRHRAPRQHALEVEGIVSEERVAPNTALEDKWWKDKGIWAIDTSNAISWKSARSSVLPRSAADIVLVQETKRFVNEGDPTVLKRQGRSLGWNLHATSAKATAADKASGGVVVAARRGTGLSPHCTLVKDGYQHRLHFAWVAGIVRGGLHCGSIWLKDCEGMSATNKSILDHAAAAIGRLRGPWVLGGDWNLPPEVLASAGWLSVVNGIIVAPSGPTCNEKVYDFFVISKGLSPSVVGVQRVDNAGLSPHYPARLLLRGDARRHAVRQLVRPALVAAALPPGPLPEPDLRYQQATSMDAQELDACAEQWHEAARREWRSLVGDLPGFESPRFRWAAAPGPKASSVPDATRIAFQWRQLAMRVEDSVAMLLNPNCSLAHKKKGLTRHAYKARQLAAAMYKDNGEYTQGVYNWLFAAFYALWHRDFGTDALLIKVARLTAERIDRAAATAAMKTWEKWINGENLDGTIRKGGQPTKRAFMYARGTAGWVKSPLGCESQNDEIPDEQDATDALGMQVQEDARSCGRIWQAHADVQTPLCDQAAVEAEADTWASLWAEGAQYQLTFDLEHEAPPAALQVDVVRRSAMSFPAHTGLGCDNIAPRAIARLSFSLLCWLCNLFAAAERLGQWPGLFRLVLIVLIPKSDGGRRPIGLFPTLVRIWMRARSEIARAWEARHQLPSLFGGQGMGAQRAAWQISFRAEAAARDRLSYAQALLDLVKAFEKLPHHLIAAAAKSLGYCLFTLRLSLAAYRFPRTVGIDGNYSRIIIATIGITAGSGFATTELRILLYVVVTLTQQKWPLVVLSLYVDDLTLEAWHSSQRAAQAMIAGATDQVVRHLEEILLLEVSTKKSMVVASSYKMACNASVSAKSKVLGAKRAAKLLGTGTNGGRRRSVSFLKARMTAFKKRAPRIQRLRRAGVSSVRITRAAGTPMITYGVETTGMANTHLTQARRAIAHAVAAEAGGKNFELVLYTADGPYGTLDPAFDAHVVPLFMWAMAHWQRWQPHLALQEAADHAKDKVIKGGKAVWSTVTGPAAAVVASAHRIGWSIVGGRHIHCDDGEELDLLLDPPVVVVQAARRAVRRWRLQNIGAALPHLVPDSPDVSVSASKPGQLPAPTREFVIDYVDVIQNLLRTTSGGRCAAFDGWQPEFCGDLRSVISGGQWPQARLASVKTWTDDNRCQLCLAATGTLAHRLVCPAICPAPGWQPPPPQGLKVLRKLDGPRCELLRTRGLLVVKVRVPSRPGGDSFRWLLQPPDHLTPEAVWYIDGSLFDEAKRYARRTGFGVAVVHPDGSLLGIGLGVPPMWVHDAAGAELWAFFVVLGLTVSMPRVVTDCLGILETLRGHVLAATSPKRVLARTWNMIATSLDQDFEAARSLLTWMPSHESSHAIGRALDSNGVPITAIMWRANRLVDALAKTAADHERLPRWATSFVGDAAALVQHHAARLGAATHAANNHHVITTIDGGACVTRVLRDSTAECPTKRQKKKRIVVDADVCAPAAPADPSLPPGPGSCGGSGNALWASCGRVRGHQAGDAAAALRLAKRRRLEHAHLLASDAEEATRQAEWLGNLDLQPCAGPSAADRIDGIRARIRARQASRSWDQHP